MRKNYPSYFVPFTSQVTGGLHQMVPKDIREEAERLAKVGGAISGS